jgi:hypothetical protein
VIGVLDEMTVRPGCLDELEQHLTEQLVPLAEARGLRLLQRWRAPALALGPDDLATGLRQQVLLLWAIEGNGEGPRAGDDVTEWWRIRRGAADPAVRAVWRVVDGLVEARTRRFLEPAPGAEAEPAGAEEPS